MPNILWKRNLFFLVDKQKNIGYTNCPVSKEIEILSREAMED